MKRIMFNDTCDLTQAVLRGTKTMTRRIVSPSVINSYDSVLFGDMKRSSPIFILEVIGNIHDNPELLSN